jgi:hypothetical protein
VSGRIEQVEAEHRLIAAHEATNVANDRTQLLSMGQPAQEVIACARTGVLPYAPMIQTSVNSKRGLLPGRRHLRCWA